MDGQNVTAQEPSIQKLQALVDNICQPGYSLTVISPESQSDILKAAELLEEVWTESEPLCAALLSDSSNQQRGIKQRFRRLCLDTCQISSQHLLLLAIIHTQTSAIVGLVVGLPCSPDVYPLLTSGEGTRDPMAPLFDMLCQLDEPLYKAVNLLEEESKGSVRVVDWFGAATSKSHAGQRLMHMALYGMALISLELGYTHAVGKLSSPWQGAITRRWGWQFLGEVLYREYEYMGEKPFEKIVAPAGVQLALGKLKSMRLMRPSRL